MNEFEKQIQPEGRYVFPWEAAGGVVEPSPYASPYFKDPYHPDPYAG